MTSIGDQLRERTVDTVLGRIRLQVGGSGAPIVFWPSLLMTGDTWRGVAGDLVGRRQVILVDPPGQGGSQPLTGYFSFDDCARCVADILDGLGLEKAHFVGNSWGGMIGATFAATYPERAGGAVLMNCTAGRASLRQKVEFAILLRVAKWTGGIGPLLNRSVLKAFLGPTTMRERPDVVAHVTDTVKSVNIGQECGPAPAGSAGIAGPHTNAGAGCRRRRGCDVPGPRRDRHGQGHPERIHPGSRRGGSPCRPREPGSGERTGRAILVRRQRKQLCCNVNGRRLVRPTRAGPPGLSLLGLVVVGPREAAALREQREHHIVQLLSVAAGLVDRRAPHVAVGRHP